MKLERQILLGFAAGVAIGLLSRVAGFEWLRNDVVALRPLGTIFIQLITMVVVPLVVGSVFVGVASLGSARALGRVGGKTLVYFIGTTVLAALVGLVVALLTNVGGGQVVSPADAIALGNGPPSIEQTLMSFVPRNPFAMASGSASELLPLIIAVCIFGAAAATSTGPGRDAVVAFFRGVNDLSMIVIGWMMTLAPAGVFVLIATMIAQSGAALLGEIARYVLVVLLALAVHVAVVLLPALRFGARAAAARFVRDTSEPLLLAFSTASSNATLPVTMTAARERLGVPDDIAGLVLPTGASLDKNGSATYKAVTAIFIAHLYGVPVTGALIAAVVLLSTFAAFAGAGVPASSLVTTVIVLDGIGLETHAAAAIALVAAVDRPLDMCRTTVNTFGNLIGATWIARSEGRLKAPAESA